MSWGWSHTQEGLDAARFNLGLLSREVLIEILAEWEAAYYPVDADGNEDRTRRQVFSLETFYRVSEYIRTLPTEYLADEVWMYAERGATCENGGGLLWMCPFGCNPHCVKPE